MDISAVWEQLTSTAKLERDRGEEQLDSMVQKREEVIPAFVDRILSQSRDKDSEWQIKLGILSAATILSRNCQNQDLIQLAPKAIEWLSDDEVRVRIGSGEFLGALCKAFGPKVYEEYKDSVFALIGENIERSCEKSMESIENSGRMSPRSEEILHDTAGWRNLESSMKCLQSLVNGCGQNFRQYVDQNLLDLIFTSLQHQNRFVRETGYQTTATVIEVCSVTLDLENPVVCFAQQFAKFLSEGLADNWSQVRMSAAVASRQFLVTLGKCNQDSVKQTSAPLLPRICLNRYYLAEGVRIYSQETWVMIVGKQGKALVENDIGNFVKYYVDCTKADNHAVREAACQCIAELAAKVGPNFVEPYVELLLETLIECFEDESWPVRDMACVACGSFVASFPQPSMKKLPQLKALFLENLKDPISSVRQGAAQALGKTVKAYGDSQLAQELIDMMGSAFDEVKNQPVESHRYGELSREPANFGVVKQMRDNDPMLHENQTMYSCGSLAPKMKRGGGGCTDCKFRKPSEPWENADGSLYLICEMSSIQAWSESLAKLLPKVEEAVRHHHYTMHFHLLETLAKVLPPIAKNLGKRLFKPHVERFFDPLFYACESDHSLAASVSSRECLTYLAEYLGVNILKGRVEQYNPNYLRQLEIILDGPISRPRLGGPSSAPMMIPSRPTLGGTPTGSPS